MAPERTARAAQVQGARSPRRGPRALAWPLLRVGANARQLLFVPPDPWPGNIAHGRRLLAMEEPLAWGAVAAGVPGNEAHRFAWLRDLRAVGGDAARQRCQTLVKTWIADHGLAPERALWSPGMIADRLVHWIGQFDFFGKPAPQSFKAPFFRSMAHQARALARAAPRIAATPERVRALRALISFGAAVPGAHARLDLAIGLLSPLVEAWPGHGLIPERDPSGQLAVLRDLIDIRAFLVAAHHETPPALELAVARTARALAAMRHGDGGLALFHGGAEEDPTFVDVVLALAGAEAVAPSRFSAGYERASGGDGVLLFDAAGPPPPGSDRFAHAGALAFEFSAGPARLIVNCGAYRGDDPAWRDAGRMTAAHSTLVVSDRNSAEIVPGGGIGHRPGDIVVDRREDEGATWIAGTHDGYARRFAFLHRRRLFLAADGADLRGEDRLVPVAGRRIPRKALGAEFRIRFHLHPDVVVAAPEPAEAGGSAIPFGSSDSGPWRFIAEGGLAATVEDSFYLGRGGAPMRAKQIVLAGRIETEDGAEARWAIKRMR